MASAKILADAGSSFNMALADSRLSGSGFPDNTDFLFSHGKADILDRVKIPLGTFKDDVQVFDVEQRVCGHGQFSFFGSRTSRNPSPSRLNARLTMKIAAPGMVISHQ